MVVEEHQIATGGWGAPSPRCSPTLVWRRSDFLRLALPDEYVSRVGSHEWLLDQFGLTTPKIVAAVRAMLGG